MADKSTGASLAKAVEIPINQNQQEETNKFQKAISAWRNIDLTSLIPSLDSTASEIIRYQRDSTLQRKELSQRTKEFRKLNDTSKLVEIRALLKNYQSFIDLLTNHIKSTNSAYLSVYSSLSEAPDPYPLLEASVDSLLLSEDTLPKVLSENKDLQKSVKIFTAQLEETESKLQVERSLRISSEEKIEAKVKEVEAAWAEVLEEKKDDWEAKEKFLEEKIESQERLINEIKASYEVSRRLGESEQNENGQVSLVTSAEMEMISSDLERTSTRLAEVEARNEQLRLELVQSASHSVSQSFTLEDDPGYMRMRSENASLLRKIEASRVERDVKKRELDGKMRTLEREISLLKEERDNLKSKVQKWCDYEELKNELDILKSVEFSMGDDEDAVETLSTDQTSKVKGETLEQLLLSRNKKVTDELTVLRVSHADLVTQIQKMKEELSNANSDLEKLQHLNSRLENDLASVHETANMYKSSISVSGNHGTYYSQSSTNLPRQGETSPTSSIISGFGPKLHTSQSETMRSIDSVGAGSTILPMITAQRDRFKKRNTQLENELSEAQSTVSSLRHEIASLQRDNMNLYEKTRFVSSYSKAIPSSSPLSPFSTGADPSTVKMVNSGSSGFSLNRYRSAYESNISPFAAFRGRESARAYKRMSLPERIIFSITRLVLATRLNRNLFTAYCAILHLLVFFSLYWLGSMENEQKRHKVGIGGAAVSSG
ncbi:Protein CASP [Golovinomyces cichoracearum]|uniref:Protein CASP n=1 Tax=Golovinomyces cichoracearum TaxID=62708 RepID=A0A420HDE4_9PEZI|nr:Protein CASP [Golovinomyces cichoracearum]